MGIGPIPYSAMRAYALEYNIRSRDEFDYFVRILQAMDVTYLKHANSTDRSRDKEMVPVTDVDEQHRLFKRLAARAKK
jgi:hypothetical protein